ncbi:MAG: HEAT repeat domain-containing protein [Treponema sp.]|jgi:HEAT repeat protein|nr:HEAT repeat domain-containing protein [Treponema sp.]
MKNFFLTGLIFLFLIETPRAEILSSSMNNNEKSDAAGNGQSIQSIKEERMDIIRYGTETEIAALIRTLKEEKTYYLNEELVRLSDTTKNPAIITGIFSFLGEQEKGDVEKRALRILEERDEEANETVLAAINYLGIIKNEDAMEYLQDILGAGEQRFTTAALRTMGRLASGNKDRADEAAEFLIDYYNNNNPGNEDQREIIVSIGESGSVAGISFLSDIIENNDERAVIRIAAVEALSKIGDPEGLPAIIYAVSSNDPNIRSTAVASLGPFNGDMVDKAILDGFRDSYYRTRIAAAKAAKERKLDAAVPYLRFRAEKDDVPTVKEDAIRALGAIFSDAARDTLNRLFLERKNSDTVRILAAEMLIENDAGGYTEALITELDEAKKRRYNNLYNGFLKVLSKAKTGKLEDTVRRFLSSGDVTEKFYALDIIVNNNFRIFIPDIQELTNEKNGNLSRRAKVMLEKLENK